MIGLLIGLILIDFQILSATERRHAKSLRELELEKERKSAYAAQGDDVVAFLEKEREKLQQQVGILNEHFWFMIFFLLFFISVERTTIYSSLDAIIFRRRNIAF